MASPSEAPSVQGYPGIGVLPWMKDPLAFFMQVGLRFPQGLAWLRLGPERVLLVWKPEFVQQVLETQAETVFVRGESVAAVRVFLGESIVTTDGPTWKRKRKLLQPVFHKSRLAAWLPVMLEVTQQGLRRWRPTDPHRDLQAWVPQMAEAAAAALEGWPERAAQHGLIDLHQEMTRLTLAILLRTAFSLTQENALAERLHRAFGIIQRFLQAWVWRPVRLPLWIPLPSHRAFTRALRTVRGAVRHVIQQRRQAQRRYDDLLDRLLHAQDPETGQALTEREIEDEVLAFFFAGHETTAVTLTWMGYLLGLHPHVAENMVAEMEAVLGRDPLDFDRVARLTYTRRVFEETLRLFPPGWILARTALQETALGPYRVPAGAHVMVAAWVTHRHPAWWSHPLAFDPDRFLPERSRGRPRYAHFPFGGGPHVCLGAGFALVEAMAILTTLLRRYRLILMPGFPVTPRPRLTVHPHPGVMVYLQRR